MIQLPIALRNLVPREKCISVCYIHKISFKVTIIDNLSLVLTLDIKVHP